MKRLWLIFLALATWAAAQEISEFPARPPMRVLDSSHIFDAATIRQLAQTLGNQNARNQVSGYVVAFDQLDKKQQDTLPDQLRDAWITEKRGFIVLYARNSDKISISLTNGAYYMSMAEGPLDILARKIDKYNEEGPSRAMPKVVDLLLEQMQVRRKREIVFIENNQLSPKLILIPFFLVLPVLGWGMFRCYRYVMAHNIFQPHYVIPSKRVPPVLGSPIGGVNTALRKF